MKQITFILIFLTSVVTLRESVCSLANYLNEKITLSADDFSIDNDEEEADLDDEVKDNFNVLIPKTFYQFYIDYRMFIYIERAIPKLTLKFVLPVFMPPKNV